MQTHAAIRQLCLAQDRQQLKNAARFDGIGTFDMDGLRTMRLFCQAASTREEVEAELQWLSQFSEASVEAVKEALWDSSALTPLGYAAGVAITPHLLLSIACECDLTEDAVFIGSKLCAGDQPKIIILPSLVYECAADMGDEVKCKTLVEAVAQAVRRCARPQFVAQIIHLPGHWTVAVADQHIDQLFFANTMAATYGPPSSLVARMNTIMQCVDAHLADENSTEWQATGRPQLLCVPQQTARHGPASCGVGVIMIIRDIADQQQCPPRNTWDFSTSRNMCLGIIQKMVHHALFRR